jgi:hypothetical protein
VPQVESQNRLMRLVSNDTSSYEECVFRFRIHLIFLDSASGNFDKTLCRRSPEDKFYFFYGISQYRSNQTLFLSADIVGFILNLFIILQLRSFAED